MSNPTGKNGHVTSNRFLLVNLFGEVVGSTFTTAPDLLYEAIHPTTGESWGLVECRPMNWTRYTAHHGRILISDLQTLLVKKAE